MSMKISIYVCVMLQDHPVFLYQEDEDADGEDSETDIIDDREPAEEDPKRAEEKGEDSQTGEESQGDDTNTPDIDSSVKPRRRRVKKADWWLGRFYDSLFID